MQGIPVSFITLWHAVASQYVLSATHQTSHSLIEIQQKKNQFEFRWSDSRVYDMQCKQPAIFLNESHRVFSMSSSNHRATLFLLVHTKLFHFVADLLLNIRANVSRFSTVIICFFFSSFCRLRFIHFVKMKFPRKQCVGIVFYHEHLSSSFSIFVIMKMRRKKIQSECLHSE